MTRIERFPAPSSGGGGGETYKAGEGLEETGSKPVTFKVKAEGIVIRMLSTEVQEKLAKAFITAGEGLEAIGSEVKVKAEGLTNAMIVAAAGIPESKLSLPEVILKTGTQEITGVKSINAASSGVAGPALLKFWTGTISIPGGSVNTIELPFKMGLTASGQVRAIRTSGTITFSANPNSEACMELFRANSTITSEGNLTMSPMITLLHTPTFKAESGSTTTGWVSLAVQDKTLLNAIAGGGTASAEVIGLRHQLTTATGWTVANNYGLTFNDATGAGTVTTSVAVNVEALTKATNNYSLRSEGAAVKLKHAGPVELTKGFAAWAHAVPASQHARIAKLEEASTLDTLLQLIEKTNETVKRINEITQEVLPEYGVTA